MNEDKKQEMKVAVKETKKKDDAVTYTLKKPITYDGREYTEFTFDFYKMTGRDYIAAEESINAEGSLVLAPEFSSNYMGKIAARAADVNAGVLESLSYHDFQEIKNMARNFMLNGGK